MPPSVQLLLGSSRCGLSLGSSSSGALGWAGPWPLSQVSPECQEQAELGYTQLMGLMKFLVFETSYLWQDLETALNYMEGKARFGFEQVLAKSKIRSRTLSIEYLSRNACFVPLRGLLISLNCHTLPPPT